jgi:signal peptidase I
MNQEPDNQNKEYATPSSNHNKYPRRSNAKKGKFYSFVSSLFVFLVVPVAIALLLTAFIIQSYQVDGESMETTLQHRDRLLVEKLPRTWARITNNNYIPDRGDIVVFNQSGLPDSFYQKQLIKRVIGLPGERVVVKNGFITVYNSEHSQGFNPDTTGKYKISSPTTIGDIDVSLDSEEIFVCGDNRNNSEDSRYFGPVNSDNIVGKLVVRLLPINKAQKF